MRQSTTYIIATSFLATVLLIFIIKKPDWSTNSFGLFDRKGSFDENTSSPMNGRVPTDISSLISSQPYNEKLCELDRFVFVNIF